MSSFGFICAMDDCVPGTERDAPKPFERWKCLSWSKVFCKITNQASKGWFKKKNESKELSDSSNWNF